MKKLLFALVPCAWLCACGDSSGGGAPDAGAPDAGVTVSLGELFPAGTALRDHYGGGTVTVAEGGTVTVTPGAEGVVLLERDGATPSEFDWGNVTSYQVIVDRFANGDPSNDGSYGREKDGAQDIGTWHGGDWAGLIGKLDYLEELGVTAIWISPIVEQVHGWVGGGSGDFKAWGYHGYWALDFTRLDANFGDLDDLVALVDGAHERGIRVLADVVLNHPGYATGADLLEYLPEVFFDGTGAAFRAFDDTRTSELDEWNNLVNYSSQGWHDWWSPRWIRAGFPGFPQSGPTPETMQVTFLPDFITEGGEADRPVLFQRKADTGFTEHVPGTTVRGYLVKWHCDWVRRVGFDGFRVDTVRNVELASFQALQAECLDALAEWKAQHPDKKLDDAPFWMTGEHYGHGVEKDNLYTAFDSVINFELQSQILAILQTLPDLLADANGLDATYARYAAAVGPDPTFGILSYISSHDTRMAFENLLYDPAKQRDAGTALLLAPGGVNIYYGDESGRRSGPPSSDPLQATRSDMNFDTTDATILEHWKKLATFRKRHAAIGRGAHARLESPAGTYAFSRVLADDVVVVVLTP